MKKLGNGRNAAEKQLCMVFKHPIKNDHCFRLEFMVQSVYAIFDGQLFTLDFTELRIVSPIFGCKEFKSVFIQPEFGIIEEALRRR